MYHNLIASASVDGHLSYFHSLGIVNDAALSICLQVFMWMYVFTSLGDMARSRITGSYDNSMVYHLKNFQTVFQNDCIIFHSYQ